MIDGSDTLIFDSLGYKFFTNCNEIADIFFVHLIFPLSSVTIAKISCWTLAIFFADNKLVETLALITNCLYNTTHNWIQTNWRASALNNTNLVWSKANVEGNSLAICRQLNKSITDDIIIGFKLVLLIASWCKVDNFLAGLSMAPPDGCCCCWILSNFLTKFL